MSEAPHKRNFDQLLQASPEELAAWSEGVDLLDPTALDVEEQFAQAWLLEEHKAEESVQRASSWTEHFRFWWGTQRVWIPALASLVFVLFVGISDWKTSTQTKPLRHDVPAKPPLRRDTKQWLRHRFQPRQVRTKPSKRGDAVVRGTKHKFFDKRHNGAELPVPGIRFHVSVESSKSGREKPGVMNRRIGMDTVMKRRIGMDTKREDAFLGAQSAASRHEAGTSKVVALKYGAHLHTAQALYFSFSIPSPGGYVSMWVMERGKKPLQLLPLAGAHAKWGAGYHLLRAQGKLQEYALDEHKGQLDFFVVFGRHPLSERQSLRVLKNANKPEALRALQQKWPALGLSFEHFRCHVSGR